MTVAKNSWLRNRAPKSFRDRHRKCYPWCLEDTCQLPSFHVGFSATSRSRCQEQSCLKKIGKSVLKITYKRHNFLLQTPNAPLLEQDYHAACFFQCQSRGLIPRICESSSQLKNFSNLSREQKTYINRMVKHREALWETNSKLELNQIVKGKKMPAVKKARILQSSVEARTIEGNVIPKTKKKKTTKGNVQRKNKKKKTTKDNSNIKLDVKDILEKKESIIQPKKQRQAAQHSIQKLATYRSFAVYRPKKRKSALSSSKKKAQRRKLKKKISKPSNAWMFPDDDWKPS